MQLMSWSNESNELQFVITRKLHLISSVVRARPNSELADVSPSREGQKPDSNGEKDTIGREAETGRFIPLEEEE
jgi:hypothetical protein